MNKQPPHLPSFNSQTSHESQYHHSVSVLIVGAGPTGLAAANFLGLANIDTLLIERNPTLSDTPRAIALDDEGLRICQNMGLSTQVSQCLLSDINALYISGKHLLVRVAPTSKRNGHPFISTFFQPDLEAALFHGLKRFPCVDVRFQHTIETFEQTETGVIVSIRTAKDRLWKVKCTYLLACDGGRSTIRHLLNIPMHGTTFAQKWLVIDCLSDQQSSTIVKFFCNPHRPAVTVPSPNNRRRWEFMLLPGENEQDLLNEEIIATLIQQTDGSLSSPSLQIIRHTIYAFQSTLAKTFYHGRVFLLGDAAHMMPPFGGQGLNSGLRDAHNLSWKIAMVMHGQASSQLLYSYHQERHRHVAQMIKLSSFLGSIVMTTARPTAFIRDTILRSLNAIPITREFFTQGHMKPQPRYLNGFFLADSAKEAKALAGLLLPQPLVTTRQGHHVLLDDILGSDFALLRCHRNPSTAFSSLKTDFWQHLNVRRICILPPNSHFPTETASPLGIPLTIVQSNDLNFLRTVPDLFVVVRPDRHIFGAFREERADTFVSAFQRKLQGQC